MKPAFAIITPLLEEWEAVCKKLDNIETIKGLSLPAKRGCVGNYDVVCVWSDRGQARAADAFARIMENWEPRWVLLVGIAGGFGKFQLGDVLIASHVYGYEFGKLQNGKYIRRPDYDFHADRSLLQHAEMRAKLSKKEWVKKISEPRPDGESSEKSCADIGYVASGDKVIDDPDHMFFRKLRTKFDELDGVEMEAVGGWASIWAELARRAVGMLMIRGISDCPDRHARRFKPGQDERAKWKKYAADAAAAFAIDFISTFPKKELHWDMLIDSLLDRHFLSIKERLRKSAREAIEDAFGTSLKVIPRHERFPAIVDPDHLDPDILLEAKLFNNKAFERHVPVSHSDLELLDLYQEPSNYQKMIEKLKNDRVLFLCGGPGVGKSLTALRIVQDFFKLGIRPLTPPLPTESAWKHLETLESSDILYLDDPFGKSRYIGSPPPDPRMTALIDFFDRLRQENTGYLLISTRTNVFDEFIDQADVDDRGRLKTRQMLLDPEKNYAPEVRQRLLISYAERYNCPWRLHPSDVKKILSEVSEAISLPLNIKHFCDETDDLQDAPSVLTRLEPYRYEPLTRYRKVLREASDVEILYLIFAKYFQNAFLRKNELQHVFALISQPGQSQEKQWATCERIYRSWFAWEESGRCRMTHPSIEEAITEFFEKNSKAKTQLNAAFVAILSSSYNEDTRATAAAGMPQAIGQLSAQSKDRLSECLKDSSHRVRTALAQALASNIRDLRTSDRAFFETMLKDLLNDVDATVRAAAMSAIFSNLDDCGVDLESKAADLRNDPDTSVRRQLAWAIASNFRNTRSSREVLKYLALEDTNSWVRIGAGEAILDSFEYLDDNMKQLLKELAKDCQADVRRAMVGAIEYNFPELPIEYKVVFLEQARDKDFSVIEWVIWFVANKYEELHKAFKKEDQPGWDDDLHRYLRNFAKHPDATVRKWVAEALGQNLGDLDDECRGLLKDLVEDRNALVRDAACGFFG